MYALCVTGGVFFTGGYINTLCENWFFRYNSIINRKFGAIIMCDYTVLKLPFSFGGVSDAVYPVVLRDKNNLVLVDCGYLGFLPNLETAMAEQGLSCAALTHVFITHHDHDHMGCLNALKKKYPQIRIIASETEAPYIAGELPALRLVQAEAMQPTLPDEQKPFGEAFTRMLRQVEPVKVDQTVQDGETLDSCGGCEVVATPGHTAGHTSLFLPSLGVCIAGDAAVSEHGALIVANPEYAQDLAQAEHSLERIRQLGAHTIVCYHGGIYRVM